MMNIIYDLGGIRMIGGATVLTIGTFDGVHLGHREIFNTLKEIGREKSLPPVVFTFMTHPRKSITPEAPPRILTTGREKLALITANGIDNIVMLPFNKELSFMDAGNFFKEILVKGLGVKHLVIGYDHAFGRHREGNFFFLQDLCQKENIGITRVDAINYESRPVSSSWIRAELEDGNINLANQLLGHPYTLSGEVVTGLARGRKIGFPTANVFPSDPDKIIPRDGVYAVRIAIDGDGEFQGMLNIGTNPTFAATARTIEVNILDFNKDIYGKNVTIKFVQRIRDEIRFGLIDQLIEQIRSDEIEVRKVLTIS